MALGKTASNGNELEQQTWPKSEIVIASRSGDVLIKSTLLKADHFPGCQNTKLTPLLDGAPNFRQVEGLPVYGVAIPTVRGLRNVLEELGAAQGRRRVLWHNMREEPVLYINGKPYVVREADQPFCNVEYTGIDRSRVEDMEQRLKRDVLREAQRYDNHILVTEEDDDMNVIDAWEPVTETDVQTPLEVYAELIEDGYDIDYMRVPITDEKAPKDSDFELLIQRLWNVPLDAALVFNCQMGRGRTTTGMAIATLVTLRRLGAFPTAPVPHFAQPQTAVLTPQSQQNGWAAAAAVPNSNGCMQVAVQQQPAAPAAAASAGSAGATAQLAVIPAWFARTRVARGSGSGGGAGPGSPSTPKTPLTPEAKLKSGMYGVIRSLLRVLERGVMGKAILDSVIDACSAMQNLREAIATYRGRLMAESKESRRATLMGVCLEYLERYYMLLAFTSYLTWPKFDPASPGHVTFQDWMETRPELRSVLSRMLRRNPLAALELHIPAATLTSPTTQQQDDDAQAAAMSQAEARADHIIEARGGAVLGALTILKEDYFPGMKSSRLPQVLPGAGNFRRMAGLPVYGVAMCTMDGIRNVLDAVMKEQAHRGAKKAVLWFSMREEPVVYINGLPFVLREQQRPMKNLQEYAGIDAERLERMEARLKQDVLAEAAQHNGDILVARESALAPGAALDNATATGELIDMWETVASPDAVQTPAEVYAKLRAEGLPVRYLRVPVTDGRAPQPGDIDAIIRQAHEAGFDSPMVFNCQMGAGRTTTGTVIGGLLAMYGSTIPVGAANSAEETALGNGTAPANGGEAGGPVTTPAKVLLASVLSTNSLNIEEISHDIMREELAGDSPRHSDDDRDSPVAVQTPSQPPAVLRGTSVSDMWADLSPDEVQERVSLAAGGYVGVRRVVRLLEHGDNAKRVVDAAIDANAQMVNLRVSIMRYRRPKHQYHNHKSEVSARHSSFRRGCAYLERYCLLIAFGAYLEAEGVDSAVSFDQWLTARPELQQALANIHNSPATALAAVPVAAVPVLYRSVRGSEEVTPTQQDEVLRKRRGKTLNRRIILKSYLARAADPSLPPGTPDVRQADGLPVFAVGNVSVDALGKLLSHLGAGPGGNCHVVITDVREELVVYVNGVPYIRRELEMPAAALHHAGVRARQLEALELALKEDVAHEAAKWGGKVLLHQEFQQPDLKQRQPSWQLHSALSGGLPPPNASYGGLSIAVPGKPNGLNSLLPAPMTVSLLTPPVGPLAPAAVQLSAALAPAAASTSAVAAAEAGVGQMPPGGGWQQQLAQNQRGINNAAGAPAVDGAFPGFRPVSPGPSAAGAAAVHSPPAAAALSPAMRGSASQLMVGSEGAAAASNPDGNCITAPVDVRPGAAVVPFWETLDLSNSGDSDTGEQQHASNKPLTLATCLEVAKQLQAAGFHITYRRIPLSRERTPVSSDLTDMLKQMLAVPAGVGPLDCEVPGGGASPNAAAMMREAAQSVASTALWGSSQTNGPAAGSETAGDSMDEQQQRRSIVHLVVSRTATGSSARFATAAFATFLAKHTPVEAKAAASQLPNSPSSSPAAKRMRRTGSDLGEYRGIMSLARLLPGGSEVKAQVDDSVDRCSAIGNLRDDIKACKHTASAAAPGQTEDPGSTAWAARQLGVHYLKRYFLLIAFR
eukprot:GHUV01006524.1.p1 GENE.GHUV01006524.1~~GHUV01006524.1.p1  ORF type:complete len:1656 (+),score=579.22 GHUV01006524.1:267-5234(+)